VNTQFATPTTLYHYTSIDVFQSIIETQTLRATRYDKLNDWSELRLGTDRLLETVKNLGVDDSLHDYKEFLISGIADFQEGTLEVFVSSFSEAGNSLDLWRMYTPAGGFAIGFDFARVQEGFLRDITRSVGGCEVENRIRPDPGNRLMKCHYTDHNGLVDLAEIVAKRFFRENSYAAMFANYGAHWAFLSTLAVSIYQTICCIKHGAFSTEREWRTVYIQPDPIDYPVMLDGKERPYIELTFDAAFISDVWISPHQQSDDFERTAADLREEYGLCFAVRRSEIPYRA
jgi:hypothetical protein